MRIFCHNILATIYFNFKMLPWRQAIRLPFDLGGKIKFIRLNGRIKILGPVSTSMIKIGFHGSDMFPNTTTTIDLSGELEIKGRNIRIGRGSLLRIETNGTCIFKNNSLIGANALILCEDEIEIGANLISAWNCQIMDTDTHSILDIETNTVGTRYVPIKIEDDCWIGNHVIINKGTILPSNTIVASNSLCNKDYSKVINSYCIIGGIPARLISTGKQRMQDKL